MARRPKAATKAPNSSTLFNELKRDLHDFYLFGKRRFNEIIICSTTTLFIIFFKYHPFDTLWKNTLVYFFIFPLIIIVFVLRKNPLDYGFRLGKFKKWGPLVAFTYTIIIPLLLFGAQSQSVKDYYLLKSEDLLSFTLNALVVLVTWEFFLRGFVLEGLREYFNENVIIVQMIPFALLHIGKPEIEVITCIFTGTWFGYVSYKGQSFWPGVLIHFLIYYGTIIFVNI